MLRSAGFDSEFDNQLLLDRVARGSEVDRLERTQVSDGPAIRLQHEHIAGALNPVRDRLQFAEVRHIHVDSRKQLAIFALVVTGRVAGERREGLLLRRSHHHDVRIAASGIDLLQYVLKLGFGKGGRRRAVRVGRAVRGRIDRSHITGHGIDVIADPAWQALDLARRGSTHPRVGQVVLHVALEFDGTHAQLVAHFVRAPCRLDGLLRAGNRDVLGSDLRARSQANGSGDRLRSRIVAFGLCVRRSRRKLLGLPFMQRAGRFRFRAQRQERSFGRGDPGNKQLCYRQALYPAF